ncbi:MAG TPA: toxin-antitoxin system HicB family antitoxin [Pseudonocardia sp.]|jgi:hypothetical protein
MDVTPYVAALREDLVAAASAGDEQTQRTAALLAGAIEPAARLAVMNALADLAAEVTEALDGERTVEVRLDGRQVKVVVSDPAPAAPGPGTERPPPPPFGDAGDISRITLRLMEEIKGRAERAANQQGVSLNAWISQAVQGALRGDQPWSGRGYGWERTPGRPRSGERGRGRDDDGRLRGWVQG